VTLAWLLREGYTLDDLLVLRYDWDTLVLSGLSPGIMRGFKSSLLPVAGLCLYLEVGIMDVMEGICNNEVCNLTQCGFSYDELRLLFEVSKNGQEDSQQQQLAELLCKWFGMSRDDLAAFRWRLKEWHASGLSLEMIKELGIDEDFACGQLGWTPMEFNACYKVPISELVQQAAPPPMPVPMRVREPPAPVSYAPRPALAPAPMQQQQLQMAPRPVPGTAPAPGPQRTVTFAPRPVGPSGSLSALAHASVEPQQAPQPIPARPMRPSASFTQFRAGPPSGLG
jgi:hypothetical protein